MAIRISHFTFPLVEGRSLQGEGGLNPYGQEEAKAGYLFEMAIRGEVNDAERTFLEKEKKAPPEGAGPSVDIHQ